MFQMRVPPAAVWQVTMKDKGKAYNKAMKLVLLCTQDDLQKVARTTSSASQQAYISQQLVELISYY